MTDYFVGIGGNDGNTGLSWAQRFLTLNAAEDEPVVADDTVYVGPGVYREMLTVDVDGGAGTEIVYIGDVTGENTDGVGGIVRITGSDNDQTAARAYCITADTKDHRIFRGFALDTVTTYLIDLDTGCEDWIIEDCFLQGAESTGGLIRVDDEQLNITVRRCVFIGDDSNPGVHFYDGVTQDDTGGVVENCLFIGGSTGVRSARVGGITVRNCTFINMGSYAVRINDALAGGQQVDVENCIIQGCGTAGLRAINVGEIVEDYNTFYLNSADRTNVNVGANSETYPPLFLPPTLFSGASQVSGIKFPWWFGELSEWSQVAAITGSNEPPEDLLGIERPVTASKNSWGARQFMEAERETGTTRGASVASLVLRDAGRHQIWVPVEASSTTISVYVYREANYAGGNPQMIVKQPGQADDVTTDAAAASQWNELTTTLTPAADPPYVVVELVSENTAAAGNYDIFFDDLTVS